MFVFMFKSCMQWGVIVVINIIARQYRVGSRARKMVLLLCSFCNVFVLKSSMAFCGDGIVLVVVVMVLKKQTFNLLTLSPKPPYKHLYH